MTEADILALPINDDTDIITDPQTGHTTQQRKPARFLIREDDVFCYHLSDGTNWTVGRDHEGVLRRERLWL